MGAFTIEFEDELTPDEAAYVGGALKGLVERLLDARTLAPHVVKHNITTTKITDDKGKPVLLDGKQVVTTTDAVTDCPDCTRGLTGGSLNGVAVRFCIRINRPPWPEGLKPTPNDIIACGGGRS